MQMPRERGFQSGEQQAQTLGQDMLSVLEKKQGVACVSERGVGEMGTRG